MTVFRVGHGYDIHRLQAGRPLILGGVRFAGDRGLTGHSDGDAVLHAVIDALLGAAGLDDIGALFPPGDPRFRDADSFALLQDAVARVQAAAWRVENVDITVVAEWPRIRPRAGEMRSRVAAGLGIEPERVNLKGKTNEGLDAVGRGEAIAAWAVALLARDPAS